MSQVKHFILEGLGKSGHATGFTLTCFHFCFHWVLHLLRSTSSTSSVVETRSRLGTSRTPVDVVKTKLDIPETFHHDLMWLLWDQTKLVLYQLLCAICWQVTCACAALAPCPITFQNHISIPYRRFCLKDFEGGNLWTSTCFVAQTPLGSLGMGAVRESDCFLPVDRREVEWQVVSIDILHKGKNLHSEVGQFPQPPEKRLPSGPISSSLEPSWKLCRNKVMCIRIAWAFRCISGWMSGEHQWPVLVDLIGCLSRGALPSAQDGSSDDRHVPQYELLYRVFIWFLYSE